MSAQVLRKRTSVWLGGLDIQRWHVHTEDDMVMIEAADGENGELEVFIAPELFPHIEYAIALSRWEPGTPPPAKPEGIPGN